MPKLSELQDLTLPVAVPIGSLIVNVEIRLCKFTARLQRQMNAASKAAQMAIVAGEEVSEEAETTAVLLTELISSWDVTEEDGRPCPVTVDFLVNELGYPSCNKITTAIIGAIRLPN